MHECPHCGGKGYFPHVHEPQCVMSYNDYCTRTKEENTPCWVCDGTGEISAVALAVYKCRGARAF